MENIMRELPYQVFVYGSLKRGEYNNDCITQHGGVFLSTAKTIGTYLLFGGSFPKLAAYHDMSKAQARQHKSYKGHVAGELWRVSAEGLAALDRLEGCPQHYRRETIEVSTSSGIRQPWAYFIVRVPFDSSPLLEPDRNGVLEWGSPRAETKNPFRARDAADVEEWK